MRRQILFPFLLFCMVVSVFEAAGMVLLRVYPAIEKTRQCLAGDVAFSDALNTVSQAYLLYIPAPGFSSNGVVQHNAQGYRGDSVPLVRSPDSLRILFMGGSTTYGEAVQHPHDSYPAQFGVRLAADARFGHKKIEIINAGVRWGTTAEILNHYLLKFRYYRPDIVVLNPGGNDPAAYASAPYHPDYSNWRKAPDTLKPLRGAGQWLVRSRFLGAVVVLLFFPDVPEGTTFVHHGDLPAHWFVPQQRGQIQLSENAFYNNLSAVVREIRHDGAELFLLSYQGNPFDEGDQAQWRRFYDYEENVLKQIGLEQQVAFAPFPLANMLLEDWADPSHLTASGEKKKALYLYEQALPVLLQRAQCESCGPVMPATKMSALSLQ